jgi:hypothetical protein
MLAHLESCRDCSVYYESMGKLRADLGRLAQPPVPARLTARLRVLASHERERRLTRVSLSARISAWAARAELAFDNLMRPMALPIAGGLLSALLLFSVLVPNLSFAHNFTDQSFFTVPVGLVVEQVGGSVVKPIGNAPRIASADADIPADSNVVDLMVDENGHVSDYYVVHGKLTPDVQSIILFSQFMPATNLGVPVSAKVRVIQGAGAARRASARS